jgi:hypothetical protein
MKVIQVMQVNLNRLALRLTFGIPRPLVPFILPNPPLVLLVPALEKLPFDPLKPLVQVLHIIHLPVLGSLFGAIHMPYSMITVLNRLLVFGTATALLGGVMGVSLGGRRDELFMGGTIRERVSRTPT